MTARLLCRLALHRWAFRDKRQGRLALTYARCTRPECAWAKERIVNVDRLPESLHERAA